MHPADPHASGKCGAKTRSGEPCKADPVRGRKRCRMHGGTQPIGPASPNWKHGRRSQVTGPLLEALARAEDDEKLLDLRAGVALFDVRLEEISRRLEAGDAPALRTEALELLDSMQAGDAQTAAQKLRELRALLERGVHRDKAWENLLRTQERRSMRAEQAADRWLKQAGVFHVAELQVAVSTLIGVLADNLPKDTVATIVRQFDAKLPGGSPGAIE